MKKNHQWRVSVTDGPRLLIWGAKIYVYAIEEIFGEGNSNHCITLNCIIYSI